MEIDFEKTIIVPKIKQHLAFVAEPVVVDDPALNHIQIRFANTFRGVEFRLWGFEFNEEITPVVEALSLAIYNVKDPDQIFKDQGLIVSIVDLGLILRVDLAKDQGVQVAFNTTVDACGLGYQIKTSLEFALAAFCQKSLGITQSQAEQGGFVIEVLQVTPTTWTAERATDLIGSAILSNGGVASLERGQIGTSN